MVVIVMSQYTTELRHLVDAGYDLGMQEYEIFDESYRSKLNNRIIKFFYFREIGFQAPGKFVFKLNQKLDLNATQTINILPLKRGYSGRIIKLQIDYFDKSDEKKSIVLNSEYDIRNALHNKFLYSSAITIEQKLDDNRYISSFKFNGAGWGHGVGLCQIGALGMALDGYSCVEILQHYFKGASIDKIYWIG